jgi:hypothetical protein
MLDSALRRRLFVGFIVASALAGGSLVAWIYPSWPFIKSASKEAWIITWQQRPFALSLLGGITLGLCLLIKACRGGNLDMKDIKASVPFWWYKIPTKKALLMLYTGTLSIDHIADDGGSDLASGTQAHRDQRRSESCARASTRNDQSASPAYRLRSELWKRRIVADPSRLPFSARQLRGDVHGRSVLWTADPAVQVLRQAFRVERLSGAVLFGKLPAEGSETAIAGTDETSQRSSR